MKYLSENELLRIAENPTIDTLKMILEEHREEVVPSNPSPAEMPREIPNSNITPNNSINNLEIPSLEISNTPINSSTDNQNNLNNNIFERPNMEPAPTIMESASSSSIPSQNVSNINEVPVNNNNPFFGQRINNESNPIPVQTPVNTVEVPSQPTIFSQMQKNNETNS